MREDTLDEVQAVGQAICLEQRPSNLRVTQSDQTVAQLLQLLLNVSSLGLGLQSTVKQLNEACQGELIHIVHLEQVTEDHEKVATDH